MFKKDTIITIRQKKTEGIILLCCFILSNILNFLAIIIYKTNLMEMLTEWFAVLVLSFVFYVLTLIVRLAYYSVKLMAEKLKRS